MRKGILFIADGHNISGGYIPNESADSGVAHPVERIHIVAHLAMVSFVRLSKFIVDHIGVSVGCPNYSVGAAMHSARQQQSAFCDRSAEAVEPRRYIGTHQFIGKEPLYLKGLTGRKEPGMGAAGNRSVQP